MSRFYLIRGFLTKEYIAGRRVHYVPPIRLYLFISIIFFLSLSFFVKPNFDDLSNQKQKRADIVQQIDSQLERFQTQQTAANSEKLQDIANHQQLLKQYKTDISQSNNTKSLHTTIELVQLELLRIKNDPPLTEKQQQKLERLKEKLKTSNTDKTVSISNNEDGTLSLDFLSDKNNKILNAKADEIETKASELLKTSPEKLLREAINKLPQIMFVILPLFALLLKFMFVFSKRLYMEHLTVALHSHSFIFLAVLIIEILDTCFDALDSPNSWVSNLIQFLMAILLFWIPVYLFIMQKRIYKQSYFLTSIKYFIISILYTFLLTIAAIIAFVWGLLSI
ncbi:DUF3667 domain-containing protein [Thalassotalea profundi]|uniref:DUF3667 domain-containing protein n=1 Tax=Thalassotalea profundi TaxID=2036687 RepID=A0ABQ3IL46_9GAMM|nr:DUF3667 domain-containing protein [Thalassotalea profundi]GHE87027.1 hypothetical protein GCM10011501_15380 [Thalassotalea profundi]